MKTSVSDEFGTATGSCRTESSPAGTGDVIGRHGVTRQPKFRQWMTRSRDLVDMKGAACPSSLVIYGLVEHRCWRIWYPNGYV